MKQIFFTLLAAFTLTASYATDPIKKIVSTTNSSVQWTGKKVTGSHTGTVNIQSGHLMFDGDQLTGGSFTIDMTSIATTDLRGESAQNLDGHLKSDDFFGVQNFPTATLDIKKVGMAKDNAYQITADITIKGITEEITFDASINDKTAQAKVVIDRTKHNVRYGSGSFFDGLGDKVIYDNFDLDLQISFE